MGSRSSRLHVCLKRWVANNCLRECGTAIAQKRALHTLKRTPCLIIGTGSHEPWHPRGSQRKHKHNSGNLDIQLPMITENQGLTKGHRQHSLRKNINININLRPRRNGTFHLACTQSFKAPGCSSFSFTSSWKRPDHKEGPGLRQVSLHAHARAPRTYKSLTTLNTCAMTLFGDLQPSY